MKTLLHLLPCLLLALVSARAEDAAAAAVRAADDARIAAMVAVDRARLDQAYSDALRYAHSSGKVDTKASYLESLLNRSQQYFSVDYEERTFTPVARDVVLMTGRARFKAAVNQQPQELYLGFLAVWRNENGTWRFVAWQSVKLPPVSGPEKK